MSSLIEAHRIPQSLQIKKVHRNLNQVTHSFMVIVKATKHVVFTELIRQKPLFGKVTQPVST